MTKPFDPTDRPDAREALFAYRQTMHNFRLSSATSALVLVDLQYGSAAAGFGYGSAYQALGYGELLDSYLGRIRDVVVPSVRRLQTAFREAGAPIIFLTVGTIIGDYSDMPPRFRRGAEHWVARGLEPPYAKVGSREIQVLEEIAPRPGEPVLVKTSASGFTATALERILWNRGIKEIAFCGVATTYCVESTLRDAADRGFDVVLVEDGSADVTDDNHQRGVRNCAAFGRVASADQLIAELAPRPGAAAR